MAAIAGATVAFVFGFAAKHTHGLGLVDAAPRGGSERVTEGHRALSPAEPFVLYEGFTSPEDAEPPVSGSLDWMLQPVSSAEFFDTYWEKRVLHVARPHMNIYAEELATNLSNVHALLAIQNLVQYEPILSVPGADPPKSQANCEWVRQSMTDAGGSPHDHHTAYLEGNTILCHLLQGYWPPIAELSRKLEVNDGFSWGANLYSTPRGSGGFRAHTDNKNGFILQVEGRKQWVMYDSTHRNPMRDQQAGRPWDKFKSEDIQRDLLYNGTLGPGDVLYVPRGVIHTADSLDGPSMHITITTVKNPEWVDFLGHFLKHFPVQSLDAAELPEVPGMSGTKVVKAVQKQFSGLLSQAVNNEREASQNSFLRASVPFIRPGEAAEARGEAVLSALDTVLLQFKATVENRLSQLIADGKVNGAVLEASFAALLGTGQAEGLERRRATLEATLKEYHVFVDYVQRLNAAGLDRKPPCELLAERTAAEGSEGPWDAPAPEARIRILAADMELSDVAPSDPTPEDGSALQLELAWRSGEETRRWDVRRTEVLAKSLKAIVAGSRRKPQPYVQPRELAGDDAFERLSVLVVLRRLGVLDSWTDPCVASHKFEL